MTEHKWALLCIIVGLLISALIYYYYHHTSTNNQSQGEIPDYATEEEDTGYVWTASEDKLISTVVEMEIPKETVSSLPEIIDRLKAYQLPNGEYQLSGNGYINIYTGTQLDTYLEISEEPIIITLSDNQILVGTTGLKIERLNNED